MESSPLLADPATAAVTALSAPMGAWGVRVHEVGVSRDAVPPKKAEDLRAQAAQWQEFADAAAAAVNDK